MSPEKFDFIASSVTLNSTNSEESLIKIYEINRAAKNSSQESMKTFAAPENLTESLPMSASYPTFPTFKNPPLQLTTSSTIFSLINEKPRRKDLQTAYRLPIIDADAAVFTSAVGEDSNVPAWINTNESSFSFESCDGSLGDLAHLQCALYR
uniref:Uncharacterized protein n=1 Tax=Syphacia muris TaxID=451379 RepID=A0A0N5AC68_9BILA